MSTLFFDVLSDLGISQNLIPATARRMSVASYDEGQVIWQCGQEIDRWLWILSGIVVGAVPADDDGLGLPIMVYGRSTWFGEQSILTGNATQLEFKCLSDVEVVSIPSDLLLELASQDAALSGFLARLSAWRGQKQSDSLVVMRLGTPATRIVMGLAQIAEGLRSSWDMPSQCLDQEMIEVPIKQGVLAQLCGVSRTVFSECILELQLGHWLEVSYGRLCIHKPQTWNRVSLAMRSTPTLQLKRISRSDLLRLFDVARSMSCNRPMVGA